MDYLYNLYVERDFEGMIHVEGVNPEKMRELAKEFLETNKGDIDSLINFLEKKDIKLREDGLLNLRLIGLKRR